MKHIVLSLLVVVLGTRVAHADARADVEAVIQAHVKSVDEEKLAGIAPTGVIFSGSDRFKAEDGSNFRNSAAGGNISGSASLKLGAMTIVVDDAGKTAWFHVPATLKYKEVVGEGIDAWAKPRPLRISGIAVNDGGWKIARVAYTATISDKDLVESAGYKDPPLRPVTAAPKHVQDNALAKAADTWFANGGGAGFVKTASANPKIVANGTAASEFAPGTKAALKLAKAWDKLAFGAESIEATTFGTGKIGLVVATVLMPTKKGKATIAVDLTLFAIAIEEADGWKWQSINWSY